MQCPALEKRMTDKLFQSKDKHKTGVMPFQVKKERKMRKEIVNRSTGLPRMVFDCVCCWRSFEECF
jgi:hypothetical protein